MKSLVIVSRTRAARQHHTQKYQKAYYAKNQFCARAYALCSCSPPRARILLVIVYCALGKRLELLLGSDVNSLRACTRRIPGNLSFLIYYNTEKRAARLYGGHGSRELQPACFTSPKGAMCYFSPCAAAFIFNLFPWAAGANFYAAPLASQSSMAFNNIASYWILALSEFNTFIRVHLCAAENIWQTGTPEH